MRVLHVIEAKDEKGEFVPRMGFADRLHLEQWMRLFLPHEFLERPSEWRIVMYGPLPEKPNGPMMN